MKEWSADHPKAKLMARKREAILAAAREEFLSQGYEVTSMEGIAARADVSIMTLYRHAKSKDDLFAAVVADACDPEDEAEQAEIARLMQQPLEEVLVAAGLWIQQTLTDPETVALLRVVIAETGRFPQLGEVAYRGLVGHLQTMIEHLLAEKDETRDVGAAKHRELSGLFLDRLCGVDMLRVLLGLGGISQAEQMRRAERARDELLEAIATLIS